MLICGTCTYINSGTRNRVAAFLLFCHSSSFLIFPFLFGGFLAVNISSLHFADRLISNSVSLFCNLALLPVHTKASCKIKFLPHFQLLLFWNKRDHTSTVFSSSHREKKAYTLKLSHSVLFYIHRWVCSRRAASVLTGSSYFNSYPKRKHAISQLSLHFKLDFWNEFKTMYLLWIFEFQKIFLFLLVRMKSGCSKVKRTVNYYYFK